VETRRLAAANKNNDRDNQFAPAVRPTSVGMPPIQFTLSLVRTSIAIVPPWHTNMGRLSRSQSWCRFVQRITGNPFNALGALDCLAERNVFSEACAWKWLWWRSGCGQGPGYCSRRTDQCTRGVGDV